MPADASVQPSEADPIDAALQRARDAKLGRESNDHAAVRRTDPADQSDAAVRCSFSELFQFADSYDMLLMMCGVVGGVCNGGVQIAIIIVFGDVLDAFNEGGDWQEKVNDIALQFVLIGLFAQLVSWMQVAGFSVSAQRQTRRLREAYLEQVLRQDISWFDTGTAGELTTRAEELCLKVEDGLGRKVGDGLQFISMFLGGFLLGGYYSLELTLVLMTSLPVLALSGAYLMWAVTQSSNAVTEAYAQAGGVANETLSNIRTVASSCGEDPAIAKYTANLRDAERAGISKGMATGLGVGVLFFACFGAYSLAWWRGSEVVADDLDCTGDDCMTGGRVLSCFFGVLMGSMGLGQAAPSVQAHIVARAAMGGALKILRLRPVIDSQSTGGLKPPHCGGDVQFRDITFAYPSRPDSVIYRGFNLTVPSGKVVALCGPSGGGKSTVMQLLERFYDPQAGQVLLDGVDISTLNIKWLRQQIGLVSQEPVLFAMTIRENIRYARADATDAEIEEACRMANAYDFIKAFPKRFNTQVGEAGVQLSGGQKQRIAIARAIVKNPKILLLDEATSALDTESERVVQAALDKLMASRDRTTLVIAHRLSTIQDADCIAVINDGVVTEQGTHEELMGREGLYSELVRLQSLGGPAAGAEAEAEAEEEAKLDEPMVDVPLEESESRGRTTSGAGTTTADADADDDERVDDDEEEAKDLYEVPKDRVWALSRPNMHYAAVGFVGAFVSGAVYPVWGWWLAEAISTMYGTDPEEMRDDGKMWAWAFAGLGVAYLGSNVAKDWGFAVVGERLTTLLRTESFTAMLRQETAFFDDDRNSSGALTARLSKDAAMVQGMTTEALGRMVMLFGTIAVGLVIAFGASWEMTLVMFVIFPLLGFASWVQMALITGQQQEQVSGGDGGKAAGEDSGATLNEAVSSIRTVAAFSLEGPILRTYSERLEGPMQHSISAAHKAGFVFGLSQFIIFGAYALLFWFGGIMIKEDRTNFSDMMMVIMSMMLAGFGLGQAMQSVTDAKKLKIAVSRIFRLLDRKPAIDSLGLSGTKPAEVHGDVEFRDITFAYPSRPDAVIYRGFNLTVPAGKVVALCGPSGGGKSTVMQLLERFYDPQAGQVLLDGVDISTLNVHWLRQQIGLVSQEPVLFAMSIRENIRYARADATDAEIEEACRMANAYDFIAGFPKRFDTQVGEAGVQLSGGQKQRIAIARAIVKNPKILLLDEATSALDTESERVVQAALDKLMASRDRTTLVIAHRLSTIQDADAIAVINDGIVVEQGTHEELKAKGGLYSQLASAQELA